MRNCKMYCAIINLLVFGCATTSPPATDFLGDYSRLEPHPEVADGKVFWNPDIDRAKYASIMIDPIEVHYAREKDFKQPDPERVREYTSLVKKELEEAISEHFQISRSQGQGVARLRVQASNIRLVKELPRTRSYVPLPRYRMGLGNVEAELTDSLTGELIVAWVGPRRSMGEAQRPHRPDDLEAARSNIAVAVRAFLNGVLNRLKENRNEPA